MDPSFWGSQFSTLHLVSSLGCCSHTSVVPTHWLSTLRKLGSSAIAGGNWERLVLEALSGLPLFSELPRSPALCRPPRIHVGPPVRLPPPRFWQEVGPSRGWGTHPGWHQHCCWPWVWLPPYHGNMLRTPAFLKLRSGKCYFFSERRNVKRSWGGSLRGRLTQVWRPSEHLDFWELIWANGPEHVFWTLLKIVRHWWSLTVCYQDITIARRKMILARRQLWERISMCEDKALEHVAY